MSGIPRDARLGFRSKLKLHRLKLGGIPRDARLGVRSNLSLHRPVVSPTVPLRVRSKLKLHRLKPGGITDRAASC
jgi:hypothetical protein